MFNRYKERASALKSSEPTSGEQEQTAMHQAQASLVPSEAVESSGGSAENALRSGECSPPGCQTPERGVKQRERTLEELEDLLRHIRDEQRRLGLDSSLSTDRTALTEPYAERALQRPSEVPLSAATNLAASASNKNMACGNPSDCISDPITRDEAHISHACSRASQIAPTAHYGAVHPAILRGFGDDDESIWLVDDEETDSEAIMTPLSSSVEDLQDISEHALHASPGEEEAENNASLAEAIPHDDLPSRLHDSQVAALSAFRYRQVPGLLDSHEWAGDTGPKSIEPPPAYEALGNTHADEVDPPAYVAAGEASSAGEALPYSQEGFPSAEELRDEDVRHCAFDPWRNWGPQLRARMSSENSSRSQLGGDGTDTDEIGGKSVGEGRQKPGSNFEDRLDATFGKRYRKVAETETVEVSRRRRTSSIESGDQECILCCEMRPPSSFPRWAPTLECRHPPRVCSECMATSIRTPMHVKIWSKISCPECGSLLTVGNVEQFADPTTFRTYRRARTNERDFEVENFICRAAGCGFGQVHDERDDQPKVRCSQCGRSSCFRCEVPWHQNLSCREYQNKIALEGDARRSRLRSLHSRGKAVGRTEEKDKQPTLGQKVWSVFEAMEASRKRKKEDNLSRKVVEETSRPCPGCSMRIEKTGGCAHMTCSQCSHEFCYECGASFNDLDFHKSNYVHRPGCSLQPRPIA